MVPRMVLIDGHAVAYRQFFALPPESMTNKAGEPTNAVFGFTRVLLDILQKEKPDYLAVSFDMGLSGRDELYSAYKGTREKMPDELSLQLGFIDKVVRAFNIPVLAMEGYEADDIIGTVTLQTEAENVEVKIITGDRDLLQLLNGHVLVQLPTRGGPDEIWDTPRFVEKWGIQPHQLIDLKALMGDASDNIPGVKGIGEKTATTLLQTYETLEGIYAALSEMKGALLKKLTEGREMANISQRLARIQRDVPIKIDLKSCVTHEYEPQEVLKVFEELNFRSLRDRLVKVATPTQKSMFPDMVDAKTVRDADVAGMDSEGMVIADGAVVAASEVVETIVVHDQAGLDALVQALQNAAGFAVDTETTSVDAMQAELVGISLSVDGTTAYYIPVGHKEGQQLPLQVVVDALRPLFVDPTKPKYLHNVTYDLVVLCQHGLDLYPVTVDTMVAEWISNPRSRTLGLKDLTASRIRTDDGRPVYMTQITDLIGTGKRQVTFAEVEIDKASPYAAADAAMTKRLTDILIPEIQNKGMYDVFQALQMPLLPVLVNMEQAGVVLDTAFLAEMSTRLDMQLKKIDQRIVEECGVKLNINSPKQLSELLFTTLGLPTKGVAKSSLGYTTNAAVLEDLRDAHPVVASILEYRELSKLKGTYVDALPLLINPKTGRVHTSYNATGSSTGRLSSSNPNLQNIPIRTEVGREVRGAFIAPEGKLLLSVDYSQIELRVLAHVCGEPTLKDAFYHGQDIHMATAAAVYGIPIEQVTSEQRNFAKRVNFGLIYGMGAFRLARDSGLTLAEADEFIKRYFARLPNVQDYILATKEQARHPEGLTTLMGRRRTFPALINPRAARQVIQAEERAAINMPIQGSAADIINMAMIRLHAELKARKFKAMMTLQVHDELVLEVPEDEIDTVKSLVVDVMEAAYPLDPALKANAEIGKNWRDMD